MPDRPQPNVFATEFLQRIREREPPPITAFEAIGRDPLYRLGGAR